MKKYADKKEILNKNGLATLNSILRSNLSKSLAYEKVICEEKAENQRFSFLFS